MRDYYRCECGRRFFLVKNAVGHKTTTKHKIYHLFNKNLPREAFTESEKGR